MLEFSKINVHLVSQESVECNCIFSIGDIFKTEIVMDVTTRTIKNGDQT